MPERYGDLIVNGTFSNGTTGWWTGDPAYVAVAASGTGLEATATTDAVNLWDAGVGQDNLILSPGCRYTLSFTARASQAGTTLRVQVGLGADPWTSAIDKTVTLGNADTCFTFPFRCPLDTSTGQISFQFGQSTAVTVYLTEIRLTCSTIDEGFYVDPDSNAAKWLAANRDDLRANKIERALVRRPGARWFGDWNKDVKTDIDAYMVAAAAKGQLPIITLYNMYNRDNGGQSSGGAPSPEAYRTWIESVAAGMADRPALVIVEPDSLAQLGNLPSDAARTERVGLVAYAAQTLGTLPATTVYLDGGNATWIRPAQMATLLKDASVAHARGFAVNVANFDAVDICCTYADQITAELGRLGVPGAGFVVDTSRNGNGAMNADGQHVDWCNPAGRRLGVPSSIGVAGADYLLWIKVPGDSDGSGGIGEGIPAGTFSPYLAERLIDGT
ncbi:glycoside hydrolase family 6 protein [Streptomyces sp. NBC_00829]|uniref:glycoside hydrolase family 6 protein n=1 Tax=Streptomyces sp. NBC_00829 TaxID=2903679 RepID=UPI0038674D97|nr:glycoside hydrolase family 6 protein [Streptomyces sp. NBC_00829]